VNKQVIMVGDHAVSSDLHIPHMGGFPEKSNKGEVVFSVCKDIIPPPSTIHHVIPSPWILYSQWSRHTGIVSKLEIIVNRRLDPFFVLDKLI